ncbi:hypothetical protein GGX14DRAFT_604152 [Mycena pura]|uniref:Uncharacterized protein n=1 Tax=Mycena pura TaxID=153505 RepID=A0AAD6UM23_9AGAR|nr:hypothetical protein GGX14DRAFT_604152 [Mycena pura]
MPPPHPGRTLRARLSTQRRLPAHASCKSRRPPPMRARPTARPPPAIRVDIALSATRPHAYWYTLPSPARPLPVSRSHLLASCFPPLAARYSRWRPRIRVEQHPPLHTALHTLPCPHPPVGSVLTMTPNVQKHSTFTAPQRVRSRRATALSCPVCNTLPRQEGPLYTNTLRKTRRPLPAPAPCARTPPHVPASSNIRHAAAHASVPGFCRIRARRPLPDARHLPLAARRPMFAAPRLSPLTPCHLPRQLPPALPATR